MRYLLGVLFSISSIWADELIYISNDTNPRNLDSLEKKYKQRLLISDKRVYLIPSACKLERYFGGASQGELKLSKVPQQTQKIFITQEVFEAEDESAIREKIQVEKSIALIEGKVSKAFLEDKEGRGYGGASELPLDFSFQQKEVRKAYMKPVEGEKEHVKKAKSSHHPRCRLLDDGSAYELKDLSLIHI